MIIFIKIWALIPKTLIHVRNVMNVNRPVEIHGIIQFPEVAHMQTPSGSGVAKHNFKIQNVE